MFGYCTADILQERYVKDDIDSDKENSHAQIKMENICTEWLCSKLTFKLIKALTISYDSIILRLDCVQDERTFSEPYGGRLGRQIRTVRSILSALLYNHGRQLDDESLQILMVEAESIVNSRLLTTDETTCKETPNPLTPNHLLTQKSHVVLPRADL